MVEALLLKIHPKQPTQKKAVNKNPCCYLGFIGGYILYIPVMGDFDWCFYLKLIFNDDDIQVKLSSSPQANVHLTPRCSENLKSPKISLKEYFSITAYSLAFI